MFELFADVCPKTCENFRSLCTGKYIAAFSVPKDMSILYQVSGIFCNLYSVSGEKGRGILTGKPLTYEGVPFHRVVKNFMVQAGDFSKGKARFLFNILFVKLS